MGRSTRLHAQPVQVVTFCRTGRAGFNRLPFQLVLHSLRWIPRLTRWLLLRLYRLGEPRLMLWAGPLVTARRARDNRAFILLLLLNHLPGAERRLTRLRHPAPRPDRIQSTFSRHLL